jgi:hypothetical protein
MKIALQRALDRDQGENSADSPDLRLTKIRGYDPALRNRGKRG